MVALGSYTPPAVGSLVHARGRDWVVLPAPEPHLVRLRPPTGREADAVGVYQPSEGRNLCGATFKPADRASARDAVGDRLDGAGEPCGWLARRQLGMGYRHLLARGRDRHNLAPWPQPTVMRLAAFNG